MIKKAALVIGIAALFSACKKDYTCECTTTSGSVSSTDKYTIKGVSKARAKANCVSTSSDAGGTTVNTTCTLK